MKKLIVSALQLIVSAALIWWIFSDAEKRQLMAVALREADLWWFVPGLVAAGAVFVLQTQRWVVLLAAVGVRLRWWRCAELLLIGAFFNLFLLGVTGGDLVKAVYAVREVTHARAAVFLSIVVDRVIGMFSLAIVAGVVVALTFQSLIQTPVAQGLLFAMGLIVAGVVGLVVVSAVVCAFQLERWLPQWLPARKVIVELADATATYAKAPRALAEAVGLSIAGHLSIFLSFFFAAQAFPAKVGLLATFSVMPIVNTISALPISLGGLGVREKLFEELLGGLYGVPQAEAILISMGGYLLFVAWSLLGGIAFAFYRPPVRSIDAVKPEPTP